MTDDEIIEAIARAMFKDDQINRLDIAKAALAVARPIIEAQERERCVDIAKAVVVDGAGWWGVKTAYEIVAALKGTIDE